VRTNVRPWHLVGCLIAPLTVAGCRGESAPPTDSAGTSAVQQGDVPLIRRELLFGNPERVNPTSRRYGRQLAFRAPVDGVMNVRVAPAGDRNAARPVTKVTSRGLRQ
jgi:hypothetical protein